ncbi:MAG: PKD domain-containing protein [Candidatus Peribacteria bacterium]|nr:MAG: PKD domain-containing protein [Candidatus Peribacteria bacterium]
MATVTIAQNTSPIPSYYFANYAITTQWEQILSMFTTIDAAKNTGTDLDESFFADLNGYFDDVFPQLPQGEDFPTTYEQCRITSTNLASDYTYNGFELFLNGCYNPLTKAINKMNSQYSIKPSAKISPSSGAAPLSVTFDARGSNDPSNDTIPSSNFFRYYKDTDGNDQVIGQGPVVNHIFTSEGQYQVHLTVRSVNQPTEGILDGSQTVSVDVTPQSALVRVFANGKQLDENNYTKIGTAEAQRGVLLDASATVPTGGRTIEQHTWDVQQGTKSIYSRTEPGRPGIASVQFPTEGQFTVSLTVLDNQGNSITKTYKIIVSDPLAIIKTSPDQGDTSTKFTFDGGTSYSLVSSIKLYTWEIFDSNDQKIDTFQGKSISKQFTRPGSYTIKLTVEDEQARTNSDTIQLYVESTEPQAQFRMSATEEWTHPSQFLFDAGLSSDVDIINADDSLLYSWRFTPEQQVTVDQIIDDGKQVIASFDSPGEYQLKLTVQDSYGKMNEIVKDITIDSAMRPTIFMVPKATNWGVPVTMIARSNITPISYEWDFGDGAKESSTTSPKATHTYEKVGAYVVKLTVYGPDNQENTVIDTVFIGEKDSPIPQFKILNMQGTTMKQTAACPE